MLFADLEVDRRVEVVREDDLQKLYALIEQEFYKARMRGDPIVVDVMSPKSEYKK